MDGSRGGRPGLDSAISTNGMSRAERFEDEKRRIIESCFSKKGPDGALLESYITHIRIIEDAGYPSAPPPPNSNPELKKPRVIIVAVRKSGHVRMHKGRENVNGTFSIGKTWPLDDLSAVESFSGSRPTNSEGEQRKQWGQDIGFIVTIGKPYYWQANTPKEKQFFIASLVKIFTKYTGGNTPELIGFDEKEKEQVLGISGSQGRPPPLNGPNQTPPQPQPTSIPPYAQGQTRPPVRQLPPRESIGRQSPAQEPPPRQQPQSRPPGAIPVFPAQNSRPVGQSRREESPSSSVDYTGVTQKQSQTSLRRLAGGNQSQDSFNRGDNSSSQTPRSRGGVNGLPSGPGRFQDRSATPNSQRTMSPANSLRNGSDASGDIPPVPAPLALPPERRRPPISATSEANSTRRQESKENLLPPSSETIRPRRQDSNDSMIPAPLSSPSIRRDEPKAPEKSDERPQTPNLEIKTSSSNVDFIRDSPGKTTQAIKPDMPSPFSSTRRNASADRIPTVPEAATAGSSVSTLAEATPSTPDDERPGLGPMIKKKLSKADVANTFRKAAVAANAFKPRPGGAAERLREQQSKSPDGPDGITSVVPAPSLVRAASSDNRKVETPDVSVSEKAPMSKSNEGIPEVKITVPPSDRPNSVEGPVEQTIEKKVPEKAKREARRPKPTSEATQKQLTFLGVDAGILNGRGAEFANLLDEFGWAGVGMRFRNIDQMKDDIDRELNTTQAGGWLSRLEEEDDRVEAIKKGIDLCISECEELDGLLTLYGVELGTLSEDIAYIEAQSQGLQVQTANQKLLQIELKSLLETISISTSQLQSLREASLESPRGLEQIETALVLLYKAMVTIDPSLNLSASRPSEDGSSVRPGKAAGIGNSEIGSMRVLQEKKDIYRNESIMFLRRLKPFLQVKFGAAIDETKKAIERERDGLTRRGGKVKVETRNHDLGRKMLWRYSPLMLFSREVDRMEWEDTMKTYESICRPVYQEEFRLAVSSWKKTARKVTGDESEILFTSQIEKQTEGLASTTARKLTVKRSGTLGKVLRSPIGDGGSKTNVDKVQDGRLHHYEVFSGALEEVIPLMIMEQNFIVEFFHISSLELRDFPDAVAASPPEVRQGSDLRKPKPMDPNRDLAKRVVQSMEEMYSFFPSEMQSLVDWSIQADPLQGVGVIAVIERKLLEVEDSSQEYLIRSLQKLHSRLAILFTKFLDEQIRAIEDTKVKINKRKGVIAFIRIFPSFSTAVETMLAGAEGLDIRETVNAAYSRINKTMFESLKVIARENPSATTTGAAMGDPEDKEALNYQILLIENMNHYLEEVDTKNNHVLEEWKEKAGQEFDEHLDLYLGAVIHRPLGKLLDFLESTESQLQSLPPGSAPSTIAARASHSKMTFKRLLATYDSKEIRRGIETLKKRVEKHFGDADDPNLSRNLVAKVLDACEKYYESVENRVATINADIYDGEATIEWTRSDVSGTFRSR